MREASGRRAASDGAFINSTVSLHDNQWGLCTVDVVGRRHRAQLLAAAQVHRVQRIAAVALGHPGQGLAIGRHARADIVAAVEGDALRIAVMPLGEMLGQVKRELIPSFFHLYLFIW